jgi:hypothetical protein
VDYDYEESKDDYFLLKWSNKLEVENVDMFTVDDNVKRNSQKYKSGGEVWG